MFPETGAAAPPRPPSRPVKRFSPDQQRVALLLAAVLAALCLHRYLCLP
ncbi:MAG: hypothetical protein JRJ72_00095 [Deltaproteobacteria bacterium]|nr:hypothetical protein [Deltaproteobacteria bacterium]